MVRHQKELIKQMNIHRVSASQRVFENSVMCCMCCEMSA